MKTTEKKSSPPRRKLGERRQDVSHCISIDLNHPQFRAADSLIRKMCPGDSLEKRIRASAEHLVSAVLVGYGGYFFVPGRQNQVMTGAEFVAVEGGLE